MGNPTVEQKVKLHPLEGGYLLVDLNGNDRFDGHDYIVVDKNRNGQDDVFGDTVVIVEKLDDKLMIGTDLRFSIRDCPVRILNSLLYGDSIDRTRVMKSSRRHQERCDKYIEEAKDAAKGEEFLTVGVGIPYIGDVDQKKVEGFISKAQEQAGEACVPWPYKTWEVYATLAGTYLQMSTNAPKDGSVDAGDLEDKVLQVKKKAKEIRSSLLTEKEIWLNGAIVCAGHGDPGCMSYYLQRVCERNYDCYGKKGLTPKEMLKFFDSKKDKIKGDAALRLYDQWIEAAKEIGYR
jgi:hypothetical protein